MNNKILLVSSEFPPLPGGIGNHAYCLAKELTELDYNVTVLTESREQKEGDWQKFLEANSQIEIIGIRRRRIIFLTYILRVVYLFYLVTKFSYKAVIYSGKFAVWLNALIPSKNSIIVIHGSEIKQSGFSKRLFARGLNKAKYIVCVSNFTKEQLLLNYENIDERKITVINNGFNSAWMLEDENDKTLANNDKVKLITVGGIHQRKGQFNVVEVMPQIIEILPKVEYQIVGLPLEKERLLKLIEQLQVKDFVSFHHGLSDAEVKNLLKDAQIFMMLSEHLKNGDFEGFGIALLEAMALGIPVIGTRNSGIADAIKDNFSGKLVDPKNHEEVLTAIKQILENYNSYSANAKKWAESFRWKFKVVEYQNLINKL